MPYLIDSILGSDYGPAPTIEPFIQGVANAEFTPAERQLISLENGRALLRAKGLS